MANQLLFWNNEGELRMHLEDLRDLMFDNTDSANFIVIASNFLQ